MICRVQSKLHTLDFPISRDISPPFHYLLKTPELCSETPVQTFCNPHHLRTGQASLLHIEPIANAVADLRAEGVSLDQDLAREFGTVYPAHVYEEWRECNVKPKLDELSKLSSAIEEVLSKLYKNC